MKKLYLLLILPIVWFPFWKQPEIKKDCSLQGQIIPKAKAEVLLFSVEEEIGIPLPGVRDTMEKYKEFWEIISASCFHTALEGGYYETESFSDGTFKVEKLPADLYYLIVSGVKEGKDSYNWFLNVRINGEEKIVLNKGNAVILKEVKR